VAKAARAARAAHVELDEALISKSDLIKAERLAKDHLKEEKELKKAPFKPRTRDKKGAERPIGRALADLVSKAAQEHKLQTPVLLDLRGLSSVTDWFFVASAENSRQIRAAAEKIIQRSLEAGVKPLGHEGLGRGDLHWALVDLGDVVAHIFNAETRALYDLEGLWADAPRG
jgi:ribosome-associated protein